MSFAGFKGNHLEAKRDICKDIEVFSNRFRLFTGRMLNTVKQPETKEKLFKHSRSKNICWVAAPAMPGAKTVDSDVRDPELSLAIRQKPQRN